MGCVYYRYEKGLRWGKRQRRISHALTIFWPPTDHRQWFLLPVVCFYRWHIVLYCQWWVWQNSAEPTKNHCISSNCTPRRSSPTEYLFSTAPLYILHRKNRRIIVCICRVSFEILISIECRFFILLNCDSWAMLNSAKLISNTSCANLEFCIR